MTPDSAGRRPGPVARRRGRRCRPAAHLEPATAPPALVFADEGTVTEHAPHLTMNGAALVDLAAGWAAGVDLDRLQFGIIAAGLGLVQAAVLSVGRVESATIVAGGGRQRDGPGAK